MPGLIINGQEIEVPGIVITNFKDNPKLALRIKSAPADGESPRIHPISLIVFHTTKGIPGGKNKTPQTLRPGLGPDTKAEDKIAGYWAMDPQNSGAHIIIDSDGSVACLADLKLVCAYHAGDKGVNHRSIGIEIFQNADGSLYKGQLEVAVKLANFLTATFSIQRQIPSKYLNKPAPRLDAGGSDCVGVIGHRDCSNQRGFGDPGDFIFDMLEKEGYERVDFYTGSDLNIWKARQYELEEVSGIPLTKDGIPGPATLAVLDKLGYKHKLWALPPSKKDLNASAAVRSIHTLLDGFLPLWLLTVDNKQKILETVKEWLETQSRG